MANPKPKGKIIDVLPDRLKGKLRKPKLQHLTFSDLHTIHKVLETFHDTDPKGFHRKGCQAHKGWFT